MLVRADTISQVERDGFCIEPEVFDDREVESALQHLIGVSVRKGRAGVRHMMRDQVVRDIANDNRLLALAKSALGGPVFPFRATLFDKSADSNWLVVWHQDTALPVRERTEDRQWGPWSVKDGVTYAHAPAWALERVVALRLHLDDSNAKNGPLRVLPGSHRSGVLTDGEIEIFAAKTKAVECIAARGGVIVMRPLIVHASSKAISMKPRRVLHIEYASRNLDQDVQLAIA